MFVSFGFQLNESPGFILNTVGTSVGQVFGFGELMVWTIVFVATGATIAVETLLADDLRGGHFDAANSPPIFPMSLNGVESFSATIALGSELDRRPKFIEPLDAANQTPQAFVVGELIPGTFAVEVRQLDFIGLVPQLGTQFLFGRATENTAAVDIVEHAILVKVGVAPFPNTSIVSATVIRNQHVPAKSLIVGHVDLHLQKLYLSHNHQVGVHLFDLRILSASHNGCKFDSDQHCMKSSQSVLVIVKDETGLM
jgi:hypothetical protein